MYQSPPHRCVRERKTMYAHIVWYTIIYYVLFVNPTDVINDVIQRV